MKICVLQFVSILFYYCWISRRSGIVFFITYTGCPRRNV